MSTTQTSASIEGSLPLNREAKTWGALAIFGNTASAAVATWCFITGGFIASYTGAGRGSLAIFAGTLIGVFLATFAAMPMASRYGVEAVRSTRPTLGTRGSMFTLALVVAILVGWNSVLTIFLGQASMEALHAMGVTSSAQSGTMVAVLGVVQAGIVFALLWRGPDVLRVAGPVIAITVLVLAVVIMIFLIAQFGWGAIAHAQPLAPLKSGQTNYALVVELGVSGAVAWWPYVGGLTRHSMSTRRAIVPTVSGLGFMMSAILVVALFAALVIPESAGNPTLFMIKIGGPALGLVAMAFMILANVGTTMVGVYAATLALKQTPAIDRRLGWRTTTLLALAPMLVVVVFFATPFMDHYGTFLAFAGVTLGPVCGMQIADYYLLRRQRLDFRALYDDSSPTYRYVGGFNPVGFVSLAAGVGTYLFMLDPVMFEPGPGFIYLTASVPACVASCVVYVIGMKVCGGLLRGSQPMPEHLPSPSRRT